MTYIDNVWSAYAYTLSSLVVYIASIPFLMFYVVNRNTLLHAFNQLYEALVNMTKECYKYCNIQSYYHILSNVVDQLNSVFGFPLLCDFLSAFLFLVCYLYFLIMSILHTIEFKRTATTSFLP